MGQETVCERQIVNILSRLPECYQPIFGHPEFNSDLKRHCIGRLGDILGVYQALSEFCDRPLRVLDLGCAEGFFSFHLANRHAEVLGIDTDAQTIELCNAVAAEHPKLRVSFTCTSIESFLAQRHKRFDLVLGLSVLHHVCSERGADYTKGLLDSLALMADVLLYETALRSEPADWACSLPEDPQEFVKNFAFVRQLSEQSTPLSNVRRPLYYCSNYFWYLGGETVPFDFWTEQQHELVGTTFAGTRRYFLSDFWVAKYFRREKHLVDLNKKELEQEAHFLSSPPDQFAPIPRLKGFGITDKEAWLVRESIPGERLSEIILSKRTYNPDEVIHAILTQLIVLEQHELYHDDVRTWNILVNEVDGAFLIDFGAISKSRMDTAWPFNVFLSFLLFVLEVHTGRISYIAPTRAPLFSAQHFPVYLRPWVLAIWRTPHSNWSFQLFRDMLQDPAMQERALRKSLPQENMELWMNVVEAHLDSWVQRSGGAWSPPQ